MRSMTLKLLSMVAWSVPLLVVVQAAMIGETMFGSSSLIALHGSVGNLTFVLAAAALALGWIARVPGATLLLLFTSILLLFAQIGLGYLGHRTGFATASSVHVGLGVAIAVLSAAAAMRCTLTPQGAAAAGTDAASHPGAAV
jgi:hypothetical protein